MSLEAEQAVVASIIASDASYDAAIEQLAPNDFTDDRMALLFEVVVKFKNAGKKTDLITLGAALTNMQRWISTGLDDPLDYLHDLEDATRSFRVVTDYIKIVKKASTARALVDYCNEVFSMSQNTELDSDQMLAQAASLLPTVDSTTGVMTYLEAKKLARAGVQRRMNGEVLGVSTGLSNLDELIIALEPSTLTVLAGRPSHGKSVYGMKFCTSASKVGASVFFSLEMSPENLGIRGLANEGRLHMGELRRGRVDHQMQERMDKAATTDADYPIYIDDRGGLSPDQIRARARTLHRKTPLKLIVVDYLQLMNAEGDNDTAKIGNASKAMKEMAKELKVAVVVLSQLNRSLEQRPDKRPIMSDLRQSGQIEQDADVILFTYIHEKYDADTPRAGIGELICSKQRNGPLGTVYTKFEGEYQAVSPFIGDIPPEKFPKQQKKGKGMSSFVGSEDAGSAITTEKF